jgi:hypothetical protein
MSFTLVRSAAGFALLAAVAAGCGTAVTAHSTAAKPAAPAQHHQAPPMPVASTPAVPHRHHHHHHHAAPAPAASTPAPAPVTAPAQTAPAQTVPAQTANPIPQNDGGDHDADNNGGPSDGDGNI